MSPSQDYSDRILGDISRILGPRVADLADALCDLKKSLSSALSPLEQKLNELREIEFSSSASIMGEAIEEAARRRIGEKSYLARFAQEIRQKETQEEILTLLLDSAHSLAPRVTLFIIRGEKVTGWSSRGYSDEITRHLTVCAFARSESAILSQALEAAAPTSLQNISGDSGLLQCFQPDSAGPWHLFPLKALKRSVAVLVAQGTRGENCDLEGLSLLLTVTGLCIENVALKILNEMQTQAPAAQPQPPRVQAEAGTPDAAQAGPGAEEASAPPTEEPLATEPESVEAEEPPPPPEPSRLDEIAQPVTPEPEMPVAEAEVWQARGAESVIPEQAAEVIAPAATPAASAKEPSPRAEEEKLHADAKRFARLLVSEIKLYNEHRVQEGRENRDVYVRLKRDIDKSREMYEQRISPVVSRRIDYFHDEVVRILGENDPSALGSDYPGPRVES